MHSFEAELDNADEDDQEEEDDFDADDVDAFIPLTQTFVRHTAPQELLDTFNRTKTRGVQLDFGLQTTLLAGGGRIRGDICLKFSPKAKKNRLTQIAGIKLDCIGFEGESQRVAIVVKSLTFLPSGQGWPTKDVLQRRTGRA